eukprot:Opistho-2@60611
MRWLAVCMREYSHDGVNCWTSTSIVLTRRRSTIWGRTISGSLARTFPPKVDIMDASGDKSDEAIGATIACSIRSTGRNSLCPTELTAAHVVRNKTSRPTYTRVFQSGSSRYDMIGCSTATNGCHSSLTTLISGDKRTSIIAISGLGMLKKCRRMFRAGVRDPTSTRSAAENSARKISTRTTSTIVAKFLNISLVTSARSCRYQRVVFEGASTRRAACAMVACCGDDVATVAPPTRDLSALRGSVWLLYSRVGVLSCETSSSSELDDFDHRSDERGRAVTRSRPEEGDGKSPKVTPCVLIPKSSVDLLSIPRRGLDTGDFPKSSPPSIGDESDGGGLPDKSNPRPSPRKIDLMSLLSVTSTGRNPLALSGSMEHSASIRIATQFKCPFAHAQCRGVFSSSGVRASTSPPACTSALVS